jgi:uncharacterized protein YlaI
MSECSRRSFAEYVDFFKAATWLELELTFCQALRQSRVVRREDSVVQWQRDCARVACTQDRTVSRIRVLPQSLHWWLQGECSDHAILTVTDIRQEAGNATIDLHDDDAEHFDFMLRYIYDGDFYTLSKSNHSQDTPSRVLLWMGVSVLADKYDIENLLDASESQVLCVLCDMKDEIDFSTLEAAIHGHCKLPNNSGSRMGKKISKCIVMSYWRYLSQGRFDELVHKYNTFGADMAIAMKNSPKIRATSVDRTYSTRWGNSA